MSAWALRAASAADSEEMSRPIIGEACESVTVRFCDTASVAQKQIAATLARSRYEEPDQNDGGCVGRRQPNARCRELRSVASATSLRSTVRATSTGCLRGAHMRASSNGPTVAMYPWMRKTPLWLARRTRESPRAPEIAGRTREAGIVSQGWPVRRVSGRRGISSPPARSAHRRHSNATSTRSPAAMERTVLRSYHSAIS